ncbi:MAG TPA: formylglycine-generating enzyme family protein [Pyrinomonadaceae bacterium]|nr:formylglycine-generating enzyme family protein [Pyrinomonadaceae bacterium]
MTKGSIPFRNFLAARFTLSAIALLFLSAGTPAAHIASVTTTQGKGGTIKPLPTPTPTTRTTLPKKNTTPAKTSRAGSSKPSGQVEPVAIKTSAAEIAFWESIKDNKNPEEFREYLKKYPNGEFTGLARSRLNALEAAAKEEEARKEEARKRPPRGATIRNQIAMELVWIPPGTFMMGSKNGRTNELPVHQVTLKDGFYMGRFEVTRPQWVTLMGKDPSRFSCEGICPVTDVSWDDSQQFIQKLNQLNDGFVYRLPSEAEWEYACRAGTTTEFSYGDSLGSDQANFKGDHPYGGAAKGIDRGRPTAVGSFQPNAFGLYDMHGNVGEWCQDWHHLNYDGAPTDGSAWLNGGTQTHRIERGGGWDLWAETARSAYRGGMLPENRIFFRGFRVVASVRTQ